VLLLLFNNFSAMLGSSKLICSVGGTAIGTSCPSFETKTSYHHSTYY
jgi:hypothetical protein